MPRFTDSSRHANPACFANPSMLVIPAFVLAAHAGAQQTTLTADPAQSSVDVLACVDPGSGSVCAGDSSQLQGSMDVSVDDAGAPTTIAVSNFAFSNVTPIVLEYNFGFFGSATVNATAFSIEYDSETPTAPAAIDAMGGFSLVDVPVLAMISGDYVSSGLVAAIVGSGVIDEVSMSPGTIDGTLAIDPQSGEYTATFSFATQQIGDLDGTPVDITTDGTIVASGPAPEKACLADVNQDGAVNGLDFGAWLSAFNAMDPRADQNQDGNINGLDFGAWLSNFNAGCD